MFSQRGPPRSATERLMFAPRKVPIQAGEGIFSAIGGLFRRATPFLKTAISSGAKMAKRAAQSDLAKDMTKTLGDAAGDVMMNAAADAISGNKSGDAIKSQAGQRLQQARQDIAGLLRNKKKKKKGGGGKAKRVFDDDDDDDDDDEGSSDDDDDEPPPRKKKRKTSTKRRRGRRPKYSVFDD